jgi:hypothetical protein
MRIQHYLHITRTFNTEFNDLLQLLYMWQLHLEYSHLSALPATDTLVLFLPVKLLALNAAVRSVPTAMIDSFTLTVVALQHYRNSCCFYGRILKKLQNSLPHWVFQSSITHWSQASLIQTTDEYIFSFSLNVLYLANPSPKRCCFKKAACLLTDEFRRL